MVSAPARRTLKNLNYIDKRAQDKLNFVVFSINNTLSAISPVPLTPIGKTVIAVTHDLEEAEYLGGSIIRLE